MARKRKGRDISGWVLVDKPAGMTSTAVVNKLRWAFEAKKAGHAGTLDPDATGMLPIAFGEATKTIAYLGDALKGYSFTMRFGSATTTDDAAGEVIATSPNRPSAAEIEAALAQFIGDIRQIPPQFSAVKVDGARAYDLAREGEVLELAERDLYVDALTLDAHPDPDTAELSFVCGAGGYVRAIARDLARALGTEGHVLSLRRLWVGAFDIEGAHSLGDILAHERTPEIDRFLAPIALGLSDIPQLQATDAGAQRLKNGNPGQVLPGNVGYGDLAWASRDGVPVAVGRYRGGELHPERVFNI